MRYSLWMDLVALFPVMVLAFLGLAFYSLHRRQVRDTDWQLLAYELGLLFSEGGLLSSSSLHGEIDGFAVVVDTHDRGSSDTHDPYTRVRCTVPCVLPAGLSVSAEGFGTAMRKMIGGQDIQIGDPGLDARACFQGENPADIQALFADPALRLACLDLFSASRYSRIEDSAIILEKRGHLGAELRALLDTAVALSRSLAVSRLRPWQALVQRHPGLTFAVQGVRLSLEGQAEGLEVRGNADLRQGHAVVRVTVPHALPAGLVVSAGRLEGAIRLGDPVLDSAVSVLGTSAGAAGALLRDDALRGDLLSVLHAFPGSRIAQNNVILVLPVAAPVALEAHLHDALLLARHLGKRAAAAASPKGAVPQGERS